VLPRPLVGGATAVPKHVSSLSRRNRDASRLIAQLPMKDITPNSPTGDVSALPSCCTWRAARNSLYKNQPFLT
jgi:hypothetical protein